MFLITGNVTRNAPAWLSSWLVSQILVLHSFIFTTSTCCTLSPAATLFNLTCFCLRQAGWIFLHPFRNTCHLGHPALLRAVFCHSSQSWLRVVRSPVRITLPTTALGKREEERWAFNVVTKPYAPWCHHIRASFLPECLIHLFWRCRKLIVKDTAVRKVLIFAWGKENQKRF